MNDEAYIEAARGVAGRMEKLPQPALEKKLEYGFRLCLVRHPTKEETARLMKLYGTLKTKYTARPDLAKKLAGDPEMSAMTLVANTLLNLDETITKD